MLDLVKSALRITGGAFDGEILNLIDACRLDLELTGICLPPDSDPLVERAVITYAKANFGFDDDSGKFGRKYDAIKLLMRESGNYNNAVE
jgi:hypothetical protein